MTKEDKELLLRDLCARLPYGVKFNYGGYSGCDYEVELITSTTINDFPIEDIKPYLRPMSTMTEEERKYLQKLPFPYDFVDWLTAHHFDYRNLIEKGLALEATTEMYK